MKAWFKKIVLPLIFIVGCFAAVSFTANLGAAILFCTTGILASVAYLCWILEEYSWEIKSWFDRDGWK